MLELDRWLPDPGLRVRHWRGSDVGPDELWAAARSVRLGDADPLGRLIRWRIPGTSAAITFEELFREPPFIVLERGARALVSGLVGRIWTLRRDYPVLSEPEEFRAWSAPGTARVLFANWVEALGDGSRLVSEARVVAIGARGRAGVAVVRPLVAAFHGLIGSDGLEEAVRRAAASDMAGS